MRKILHEQMKIGEIDVASINIELHNRDEIPQLLRGLQYLYADTKLRQRIFKEIAKIVPDGIDRENGREGMPLWSILVLGTLRLSCNWDYDKLQEIANNHRTLREMLGHGILDSAKRYPRQTLCDNVRWFTPDVLGAINRIVVEAGHAQLSISPEEKLHGRCDSFVVETDVHFPTDINLLWDAVRKTLELGRGIASEYGIEGWRQTGHNLRNAKNHYRQVQKLREKDKGSAECKAATEQYVEIAEDVFARSRNILVLYMNSRGKDFEMRVKDVLYYVEHGERLVSQIRRRCLQGEKITHEEKIFSLFEPYTEWISKGKAGVPQELGLRVGIIECESGFILNHRVMQKETDDQSAVEFIKETKKQFSQLSGCSFDKGYHSPNNQKELARLLDVVVLPRKGKLDATELEIETAELFVEKRRRHSAVESAINALENHSLDRCPDFGLDGFKRYVALAVVARNIQLLGRNLQEALLECEVRKAA